MECNAITGDQQGNVTVWP